MLFFPLTFFLFSATICLGIETRSIPKTFIYSHDRFAIYYNRSAINPATRPDYPGTSPHNWHHAVRSASAELQALQTLFHAQPSDPLPNQEFRYQEEAKRRSRYTPRQIRIWMHQVVPNDLNYVNANMILFGLTEYQKMWEADKLPDKVMVHGCSIEFYWLVDRQRVAAVVGGAYVEYIHENERRPNSIDGS
ncbi:MAG: hypothetical protein L6R40_008091 [Gallowayella cf. fulva]|nr:MAG: hypothetical protein L6R40_008091 [Xanthomendoza cf. fulva]